MTDYYYYQYTGLRYRARLAGTYYRYLYNGQRVLEELNDSGTMTARYTTESGSYFGSLLHLYRPTGTLSRFPMGACPERSRGDNIGSVRGLVDASGTATDWYELDTFGRSVSSSGTTPNPYRFGGAWGYITDPSGMQQLGQRSYWPELGRFVSQDPVGHGINWYVYADNDPPLLIDPTGEAGKAPPPVIPPGTIVCLKAKITGSITCTVCGIPFTKPINQTIDSCKDACATAPVLIGPIPAQTVPVIDKNCTGSLTLSGDAYYCKPKPPAKKPKPPGGKKKGKSK